MSADTGSPAPAVSGITIPAQAQTVGTAPDDVDPILTLNPPVTAQEKQG